VLTGTRLPIPLSLIHQGDSEMFKFIVSMIGNLGQIGRITANELIPIYGGRLMDGDDADDVSELFSAGLGR
jgi:hypothetical protein